MKAKILSILMLSLLFTGCGNHNSSDNNQSSGDRETNNNIDKRVGYYKDSGIKGVNYKCGSFNAKTELDGRFEFEAGEGCIFSLAGITLQEVTAEELINNSIVVVKDINVGRMLQILDNDGNSTNDLTITDSVEKLLKSAGIAKIPSTEDEFKRLFEVAKLATGYNGKYITAQEAMEHMNPDSIDKVAPVITLRGSDEVTVNFGETYTDMGATASDDKDGEISHKIDITGVVNTHSEGNYTISYNVADIAGNEAVEVKRTVIVKKIEPIEDASLANSFFVKYSKDLLSRFRVGTVNSLAISNDGTKAYVMDYGNGVRIVDIADAKNPKQLSFIDISGYPKSLDLSSDGKILYVGNGYLDIRIIDISNPTSPTSLGHLSLVPKNEYSYIESIVLSKDGTKAYISVHNEGIKIIDTSDTHNPTLLGSFDIEGVTFFVKLSQDDSKAYVAVGNEGIKIIDISDVHNPKLLGSLSTGGEAYNIDLSDDGTKAYVANWNKGMKIIDISDATNPKLLGSFAAVTHFVKLSKDGTKAYLSDGEAIIKIIDITDANNSTLFGSFYIGEYDGTVAHSIELSDDETKVYIASDNGGLKIVDLSSSLIVRYIGFRDSNIYLSFLKNIGEVEISITLDRDDLIKVGDYAKTFTPSSTNSGQYKIPISSVSNRDMGTTKLTIKVKKDGKVGTKEVLVRVEHQPV